MDKGVMSREAAVHPLYPERGTSKKATSCVSSPCQETRAKGSAKKIKNLPRIKLKNTPNKQSVPPSVSSFLTNPLLLLVKLFLKLLVVNTILTYFSTTKVFQSIKIHLCCDFIYANIVGHVFRFVKSIVGVVYSAISHALLKICGFFIMAIKNHVSIELSRRLNSFLKNFCSAAVKFLVCKWCTFETCCERAVSIVLRIKSVLLVDRHDYTNAIDSDAAIEFFDESKQQQNVTENTKNLHENCVLKSEKAALECAETVGDNSINIEEESTKIRGQNKTVKNSFKISKFCSLIVGVLVLCCKVQAGSSAVVTEDEVLHIGGIFPIGGEGGWQGGQACMPAAYLALEDVNNRKDLLPGFQLQLHSNDSECEPGLGASVMYNLLYNPPQKLLLLAGCSTVCTTVAEAAKMWNLMVLCYGASSPALSDRRRFPTLFRTHPSATVHNPTRITLMKKFGWSRVAILQQAEEVFISTVEDLEARCKEAGIEIVTRQSFLSDPGDAVRNLRRQDARIIVGLFYVVAARRVLCDLYRQQLYGSSYVWFFIGWYEDNWFEVNLDREGVECTAEEMRKAAEGHLTTEALMWNQNQNQPTISGMTSENFRLRLNDMLRIEGYDIDNLRYPEGYQEAPLAYDAVWAVALAFNKTMERLTKTGKSLKNFTYTDKGIADNIYSAINSTSFLGVSGIVAFSSQGDRIALTQIEQMIGGQYVKLGYYDTQADNLTWLNKEKWAGGKVPPDRTVVVRELRTVSLPLFACVTAVAIAGACVAAGLVVFNIWNSHRRVIQSSHPVCNTIMLCGCTLCLAGLVALGADGRFVPPERFGAVCQARVWLLSIGFTLAYGAMFSKVWRVHRFTTKSKVDPKKKVEPWKLYTMVSGLLVIDAVILLSWQLRDPLRRRVELFPLEEPTSALEDVKIRPELEHCESEHNTVWLGVMYGYKGLVLVFGLFLAYETRSVKLRQINDSRYVGMSIYNVVVLCLITAPVSMVVASQQDASFAFVSLAVVFCCFLSMALIFVPKVIEVIRHPKDRAESKYNPDAGMSKEDEERYHKLLAENDQLQQLITAKEEKIRTLKQKISERDSQRAGTNPPGGGTTIAGTGVLTVVSGATTASGALTQGNGPPPPIAADHATLSDLATMTSDYATMTSDYATMTSELDSVAQLHTRSSRASQSDLELSESYL